MEDLIKGNVYLLSSFADNSELVGKQKIKIIEATVLDVTQLAYCLYSRLEDKPFWVLKNSIGKPNSEYWVIENITKR